MAGADWMIKEYGEEIAGKCSAWKRRELTVEGLIASHRRQRELLADLDKVIREQQQLVMEKAYDDAYKFAHEHEWFSKEVLKRMTLQELAVVLIGDPD